MLIDFRNLLVLDEAIYSQLDDLVFSLHLLELYLLLVLSQLHEHVA